MGLMRAMDSGTVAGDTGSPGFVFAMLVITIGGLFLVSALIGILSTGLDARLEELRQGRSRVIESNHTVILGWSSQVFIIINELVAANESQRGGCIAILSEVDKVEMEEAIRTRLGRTGRTRVVCRSGSPLDPAELELVNPHQARSIIVLAPETDDPDSAVLKTILALTNSPQRRPQRYHIVAQVRDARNLAVLRMVGKADATYVVTPDFVARTIVQTSRQAGLSVVWTDLLDFGGDEIYFARQPELAGLTFGEALLRYEDSTLIGLRRETGTSLNPAMDTRLEATDQLVVIAADDDTIRLRSGDATVDETAIVTAAPGETQPERVLLLGWNSIGATIVRELDGYVAAGTQVTVVAQDPAAGAEVAALDPAPTRLAIACEAGDMTDRRLLDRLEIASFDHVILLTEPGPGGPEEADARALTALLHLRDMEEQLGEHFNIVSQMLDPRNRELAKVTNADDFIVSDQLVSLMLAQLSENRDLQEVFGDLLDAAGSELYVKPVEDYVATGRPVTFATVTEAARRRGEVAIGYRQVALQRDAEQSHGVRLNPPKSDPISFAPGDRVIVLAED